MHLPDSLTQPPEAVKQSMGVGFPRQLSSPLLVLLRGIGPCTTAIKAQLQQEGAHSPHLGLTWIAQLR